MHSKDKSISCIDWHPTQKGVLAIACVSPSTLDDKIEKSFSAKNDKSVILIWSFHDPIHPQLILEAPDDVVAFQFNPEDSCYIAAGCNNGQVAFWDISEYQDKLFRKKEESSQVASTFLEKEKVYETPKLNYLLCSSIEASHRGAITDLKWLPKPSEVIFFISMLLVFNEYIFKLL